MRPVTVNNPGYVRAPTIQINAAAEQGILAAVGLIPNSGTAGTYNITGILLPFLTQMTIKNSGQINWTGITAPELAAVKLLIDKFTTSKASGYGTSRWALLQNYGQLCAYCELPVMDYSLAVEHILPKDQFPDIMLDYNNFFLCCPTCNSIKKSRPTVTDGYNWATTQQHLVPPLTYPQIQAGALDRYVWPTTALGPAPFFSAYSAFNLTLFQAGGGPITDANALNYANAWTSTTNNQVTATVGGVSMAVITNFSPASVGIQVLQAQNLIDIVGINKAVPGPIVSDRRMVNRTVNWFDANTAISRLNTAYLNDPTPTKVLFNIVLQQVAATARTAGFYSTWAKVFYFHSPPAAFSIYTLFKNMTGDNTQPQYYIPGTNAAVMP